MLLEDSFGNLMGQGYCKTIMTLLKKKSVQEQSMQSLIKSDEGNIIGHPTLTTAAASGGKSDEAPIGAKMRPNTKEAAQFGAHK